MGGTPILSGKGREGSGVTGKIGEWKGKGRVLGKRTGLRWASWKEILGERSGSSGAGVFPSLGREWGALWGKKSGRGGRKVAGGLGRRKDNVGPSPYCCTGRGSKAKEPVEKAG